MRAEWEYAGIAAATTVVGTGAVIGAAETDHTGPILAFVGALIVALITAYTSDRRLRNQLAHERRLHDLDGFRDLLKRASSLMFSESRPLARLVQGIEGRTGEIKGEVFEKAKQSVEELLKSQGNFNAMAGELLIHLPEDHPLYVAFSGFSEATLSAVQKFLKDPPAEELSKHLEGVVDTTSKNAQAFRKAAREEISYRGGT